MESENLVKQELEELLKQLGKKQRFEASVLALKSLFQSSYPSASPSLRQSFYSVVCRVATVLKTRYTAPGFWNAGLGLFELAYLLVSEPSEKEHLKACIAQAREHLHGEDNPLLQASQLADNQAPRGYLFEGHLTVDPEPPQPQWLVQSNLLTTAATLFSAESSQASAANETTQEDAASILQDLINRLEEVVPLMVDEGTVAPRAPPASKEVVAKLPVITLTEEILATLGKDAECAICRENLVLNDKMQELPCKHTFHPPCLKPWLDEHNSCPICRYELQTDDHAYESWKEREKEAEEERKGAENAIRGGEYMYV
ncbi:E3 ubiquitin-protein ligase AIP2 [Vigna unguiculata]|uniref:RING-type E3 ubiquitin transferase n=1 Tax=Vigna unguiculata TaxID=3917 RepID=A0A4D6MHQ2_VIGUN|nr:E3 ubiquitin-protein ligase AIP2 [Vigna unguiculata]QCD99254.1 E3 ubiquitin-protein ligase [Vigna unguiculata]